MLRATASTIFALLLLLSFASAQESEEPKFEIGPQLTQWYLPVNPTGGIHYQPGAGVFASYNFSRHIALDSAINVMPSPSEGSSFAGGRVVQGLFGVRAGVNKGRVGLFGKIRPGFSRFGNVILKVTPPPDDQWFFGALTKPNLDLGGIVTVAVSKRFGIRYELGDTIVFYGNRNPLVGAPPGPSFKSHNLQFATGLAIRF